MTHLIPTQTAIHDNIDAFILGSRERFELIFRNYIYHIKDLNV